MRRECLYSCDNGNFGSTIKDVKMYGVVTREVVLKYSKKL